MTTKQEEVYDPSYDALKAALTKDAQHHKEAGTLKLPVDPEEFASRLGAAGLLGPVTGLDHKDIVRAITEVCDELGVECARKEPEC